MKPTPAQINSEISNTYDTLICRCGLAAALKVCRGVRKKLLAEKVRRRGTKPKRKPKLKRPDVSRPECGV